MSRSRALPTQRRLRRRTPRWAAGCVLTAQSLFSTLDALRPAAAASATVHVGDVSRATVEAVKEYGLLCKVYGPRRADPQLPDGQAALATDTKAK